MKSLTILLALLLAVATPAAADLTNPDGSRVEFTITDAVCSMGDGSAIDSVQWTHTGGSAALIENATTMTPTVVPQEAGVAVFRLECCAAGVCSSDTTNVATEVRYVPFVEAGAGGSVVWITQSTGN